MTEDERIDYLRNHQDRLGLMMLRHCLMLLKQNYGWFPSKMLPGGRDPETVVDEVVCKYIEGDRNFSEEHAIEAQLKEGIRSWLSAIHKTKDAKSASYDELSDAAGEEILSGDDARPDDLVANDLDTKVLFELILDSPTVNKSEELQLLVMAIEDGADDPPSQSTATEIPIKRIYELRRKLQSVIPAILTEFNAQPR